MNENLCFIAIPKCAGISTSHFCHENGIDVFWHHHDFPRWIAETRLRMEGRKAFCILRDPVDRVVSAYAFLRGGGRNKSDQADWDRFCKGFDSFDDFIEFGLEPASRSQLHFLPQWFWIMPPGQNVDLGCIEFIRFSELNSDLGKLSLRKGLTWFGGLPHRNGSERDDIVVTPRQRRKILDIYSRDVFLTNQFGS